MESSRCSQRWKTLPEFKYSRRCSSVTAKDDKTVRDGGQRSVTLAPASRYLTDRRYTARKPLFSAEQQISILKKTNPATQIEKETTSGVSRREQPEHVHTRSDVDLSLPHRDVSPPSVTTEDLESPLGISELRGPALGSCFSSSRSAQLLDVHRLRPRLTSTVRYPTHSAHSWSCMPGERQHRLGGREGRGAEGNKHSPMTPHQSNYWACAIPKTSPPTAHRHSSDWDPNREYQALLDYTYPLKPGQGVWDSSDVRDDSLLQTELQDSGVDLEHLCSSTSLSVLDFSVSGTSKPRERTQAGHRSCDLPGFSRSSDDLASSLPHYFRNPVGLSLDSLDCDNDRSGLSQYRSVSDHALTSSTSTSTGFIRSTSVLARPRCVGGELDEEFLPLPEQLMELQLLSHQVREVMIHLSQPVGASRELLEPGATSILSSVTRHVKEDAENDAREEEAEDEESECINENTEEEEEERSAAQTVHHKGTCAASAELVGEVGLTQPSLGEVTSLVEQLCGLTLPDSQRSSRENQEQSDSLMRHIQVFCSHLEQLIQQLCTMSEKMELLAAPTVNIDSVKSSLAEYQSFQREASIHRPLTSCVLQTGQLLLSCIDTTSPLLSDALRLIERQSGALQTRAELFLSSILSAMDRLTQPSPVQKS